MCLLAVPFTPLSGLLKSWVFGEALCHLVPMILGVTVHVSTLTSTAIAVDRYLVIVHPFRWHEYSSIYVLVQPDINKVKNKNITVVSLLLFVQHLHWTKCRLINLSIIKAIDVYVCVINSFNHNSIQFNSIIFIRSRVSQFKNMMR